ncbi:hypothetical protein ZWY2020_047320 [Hordeum vulgare]|nr:hypothetical protein ZWY2020_047320 [Hordeum vulgare]
MPSPPVPLLRQREVSNTLGAVIVTCLFLLCAPGTRRCFFLCAPGHRWPPRASILCPACPCLLRAHLRICLPCGCRSASPSRALALSRLCPRLHRVPAPLHLLQPPWLASAPASPHWLASAAPTGSAASSPNQRRSTTASPQRPTSAAPARSVASRPEPALSRGRTAPHPASSRCTAPSRCHALLLWLCPHPARRDGPLTVPRSASAHL